jgi:hypothetical protein
MNKEQRVVIWVLCLCFLSFPVFVTIAHFWPYPTTRIDKVHLAKTEVCRGEFITFWFDGEKLTDVIPDIVVELVNGETYSIMSYKGTKTKGPLGSTRSFIVPHHVIPNSYKVQWTSTFPNNPVNNPSIRAMSDWVKIKDCGFEKGEPGKPGKDGKNFWGK